MGRRGNIYFIVDDKSIFSINNYLYGRTSQNRMPLGPEFWSEYAGIRFGKGYGHTFHALGHTNLDFCSQWLPSP